MAAEEPQDWIDRAIARDGTWEPPVHFAEQIAARGMAFHAAPRRRVTFLDLVESVRLRVEGSLWVLRQYRELLLR